MIFARIAALACTTDVPNAAPAKVLSRDSVIRAGRHPAWGWAVIKNLLK